MPTPEEILAICIQEGPGTPGPERGRAAAQRVRPSTKRGKSTYRPDHRRATQQQSQDTAVLCRWLNAENAMPKRTAAIEAQSTPAQVESLIGSMLGATPPRHLLALAYIEGTGDGRMTVTAGFTPRNPDWAGISPLWANAQGHEALIAADTGTAGLPGLVVMHDDEAWKLLLEPDDDQLLEEPPEGAPSQLANILRFHGAVNVHWIPDGPDAPSNRSAGPFTWASWHYTMPEEFTNAPDDWTLSRNLLHFWLIQDTAQASTLAMYAAANANDSVGIAEHAREEGRETAARGAAAAALLMADRAQKCLDNGRMIAQQGIPQQKSAQELQELAGRIRRTRQQAQSMSGSNVSSASREQRWYADACHRLIRHKSLTTMAASLLWDIENKAESDFHRYLMTLTAQQICTWPSDNIYEIPEPYPIGREPDPELASAVRLCEEQVHTVKARLLLPMNEASPTDISPALEDYPDLAQRLRGTLVPAVGCDCGFEYSRFAAAPAEVGPVHGSVGWTGFFWEGRRIFKGAAEAYPKTFPPQMVAGHTALLEMRFAALVSDDPNAPHNPRLQPFYTMFLAMDTAADHGWHTITAADIARVDAAAQDQGLSPEQARAVFAALTGGDPALANYLGYNSPLPSVVTAPPGVTYQNDPDPYGRDLGPRQAPPPPLRISRESAGRIQGAALAAGFPARAAARVTGTG